MLVSAYGMMTSWVCVEIRGPTEDEIRRTWDEKQQLEVPEMSRQRTRKEKHRRTS